MTHLTTETVAKALATATNKESSNDNLFESIQVIATEDGNVISVKQETDGPTAFVTVDEDQVRTISYLWKLDKVSKEHREAILVEMLRESMSLPLVSFGIEGDEVTLFGSMSTTSGEDELIEEVEALFAATQLVIAQIEEFVAA